MTAAVVFNQLIVPPDNIIGLTIVISLYGITTVTRFRIIIIRGSDQAVIFANEFQFHPGRTHFTLPDTGNRLSFDGCPKQKENDSFEKVFTEVSGLHNSRTPAESGYYKEPVNLVDSWRLTVGS